MGLEKKSRVAIFREGDKDKPLDGMEKFSDGSPVELRSIKDRRFVEWSKSKCSVKFVGMVSVHNGNENVTVYSLPKYFPKEKCTLNYLDEIKKHIKTICKVIEELRKNDIDLDGDDIFNPYEQNISKTKVSRYELAEYIIEDYYQNGLYVKDITENRKGGIGRTNWGRTVEKVQPVIQRDAPFYLEQIKRKHIIDENDFISVLHANVVNQCLDFIGALVSEGIEYIDTEPLGSDLSVYSSTVNSLSTYVFREREINLFKALEAWCDSTRYYENFAGVTCFHKVWEWVNDSVWGNVNVSQVKSGNPCYHIGNGDYEAKGEAIPDTVYIYSDNKENKKDSIVYIFDSKYYTACFVDKEKTKIGGYPANADVVKQVAYLKMIKSQYEAKAFYNSFLMPEYYEVCKKEEIAYDFRVKGEKWFSVAGYVHPGKFAYDLLTIESSDEDSEIKIKELEKENKVGIVFVNPSKLYNKFLDHNKVSLEELQETQEYLQDSRNGMSVDEATK